MSHDDFAFEPVKGLPEELPEGERMLWQGAPEWRNLAVRTFHVRKIALYFAILMLIKIGYVVNDGATFVAAAGDSLGLLLLAVSAIGIFCLIAWLTEKTTVYTITSRRVVMRIGIALPMTINIPFARIVSASLRCYKDNSGDIPLLLDNEHRLAYIVMFPHARPWRFLRPEPMLRGLDNVETVANLLAESLAESTAGSINVSSADKHTSTDIKTASQPQATAA